MEQYFLGEATRSKLSGVAVVPIWISIVSDFYSTLYHIFIQLAKK